MPTIAPRRNSGGIQIRDHLRWRARVRLDKYWGDITLDEHLRGLRIPYESREFDGNLLLAQGAQDLWNALSGGSITGGYYDSSNAALCVGDGNPTALAANATFTNGSTTVSCSNTGGVSVGDKIRLNSDGNWYAVSAITTNTSFTISTAYTGTTGTGAGAYILGEAVAQTALYGTQSSSLGGGITGVTNSTNPTITTASAHGLIVGQVVVIASVGGATGANGTWVVASTPLSTTFTITTSAPGVYTSGGTVITQSTFRQLVSAQPGLSAVVGTAITNVSSGANPTITTSAAHGLVAGQMVTIASVVGATGVNGTWTVATVPTTTTFTIQTGAPGSYSSGGTVTLINILQCVSIFGTANANFAWNEWGLANSATAQSGDHLLNRKVIYLGAKSSSASWTLTSTLSLA